MAAFHKETPGGTIAGGHFVRKVGGEPGRT